MLLCGIHFWQTPDEVADLHQVVVENSPYPMPRRWDRRFHRHTESRGREIILIDKLPGVRGGWVCLAPGGKIKTVSLLSRTSIGDKKSALPASIRWETLGGVSPEQKRDAKAKSKELIDSGNRFVELGALKSKRTLGARVQRAVQAAALVPAVIFGLGHWVAGSWWHVMGLVAVVYVTWEMAEMSGLAGWVKASFQASSTFCWAMSWLIGRVGEARTMLENTLEEISELTGFNVTLLEVGLLAFGITTLACCVAFFWDEVKAAVQEDAEEESTPSGSPSGSVGAASVSSDSEGEGRSGKQTAEALESLSCNQERLAQQLDDLQAEQRQERLLRSMSPAEKPLTFLTPSDSATESAEEMIKRLDGSDGIFLKDRGHEEKPIKAKSISEEAVASLGGTGALSPASTHESWEQVHLLPGAAEEEPLKAHMKVQTMIQQLEMRTEMNREADLAKKPHDKSEVLDPINQ